MEQSMAENLFPQKSVFNWRRRARQVLGIISLELKRKLSAKKTFMGEMVLVLIPLLLIGVKDVHTLLEKSHTQNMGEMFKMFANIFYYFYFRLAVFFLSLSLFTRLIKGEIADRTLHYFFLTPIKKSLLLIGKYLSGMIVSTSLIGGSLIVTFFMIYIPYGWQEFARHFFLGPGVSHLASYLLIVILGCFAYGSLFMMLGLIFKNPHVGGVLFLFWEIASIFLPVRLKSLTLVYYFWSFMPITIMPDSPIALVSEPAPIWVSTTTLFVVSMIFITVSVFIIKHKEINYTTE